MLVIPFSLDAACCVFIKIFLIYSRSTTKYRQVFVTHSFMLVVWLDFPLYLVSGNVTDMPINVETMKSVIKCANDHNNIINKVAKICVSSRQGWHQTGSSNIEYDKTIKCSKSPESYANTWDQFCKLLLSFEHDNLMPRVVLSCVLSIVTDRKFEEEQQESCRQWCNYVQ